MRLLLLLLLLALREQIQVSPRQGVHRSSYPGTHSVHTRLNTHINTHVFTHAHTNVHTHMNIHTCSHTHDHAHGHTCTHTHMMSSHPLSHAETLRHTLPRGHAAVPPQVPRVDTPCSRVSAAPATCVREQRQHPAPPVHLCSPGQVRCKHRGGAFSPAFLQQTLRRGFQKFF